MVSISYAICVKNELDEIKQLIPLLLKYKKEQDEIVILLDYEGKTEEITNYIDSFHNNILIITQTFTKDFSQWKNTLNKLCSKDFIFNIDADELPSILLLENIHEILEENIDCEAYWLPRENYVEGINQEWIQNWGWRQDEKGRINYPDKQLRIFKNEPGRIFWQNKVHEQLVGYKTVSELPEEYCLKHYKTLDRQIKQNEFYGKL